MSETNTKDCPECGEKIRGRQDKKFCSDLCRYAHNNRNNSESNGMMRNINNVLRKNRRVLAALNPEGKVKIHHDKLAAKGFNFNYYTNVYSTKTGSQYFFCYDYGYLPIDNGYYAIVKKQDWVE